MNQTEWSLGYGGIASRHHDAVPWPWPTERETEIETHTQTHFFATTRRRQRCATWRQQFGENKCLIDTITVS